METPEPRQPTDLEAAIDRFNAGGDRSAALLQRAFLAGQVVVQSASELDPQHPETWKLRAIGGDDGAVFLVVFTHPDQIPLAVAQANPWVASVAGEGVLDATPGGLIVNPGTDSVHGVTVQAGGVQEMRDVVARRRAATAALTSRARTPLEEAIAAVGAEAMTAEAIVRFSNVLGAATLVIPSQKPQEGTLDLDACYSFGDDTAPLLAVFTSADLVGEFTSDHPLQLTGRELIARLPEGAGISFNPERQVSVALAAQGLQTMATVIDGLAARAQSASTASPSAPADGPPAYTAKPPRKLFGRGRG